MSHRFYFSIFALMFSGSLHAMSIFNTGKACTFSGVSGVILQGGVPVAGAKVTRTTDFQKKKQDETFTDDKGYFELPARFERNVVNILPQEFVVGQKITVSVGEKDIEIWSGVKRKKTENSEARGVPISFTCELENETKLIHVNNQPFFTRCTWDVEPDVIDNGF